jgi:hypothetical protein
LEGEGMSARLAAEAERLKRLDCGFRYLAALDTEIGRRVRRSLRPGSRYRPGFLRVQHLGRMAGRCWVVRGAKSAEPPSYDFGFLHALWHIGRRHRRRTVLVAYDLVAHEWGHYWLAKSGLRNHECDADGFARVVMEHAGFSPAEVSEARGHYRAVARYRDVSKF